MQCLPGGQAKDSCKTELNAKDLDWANWRRREPDPRVQQRNSDLVSSLPRLELHGETAGVPAI